MNKLKFNYGDVILDVKSNQIIHVNKESLSNNDFELGQNFETVIDGQSISGVLSQISTPFGYIQSIDNLIDLYRNLDLHELNLDNKDFLFELSKRNLPISLYFVGSNSELYPSEVMIANSLMNDGSSDYFYENVKTFLLIMRKYTIIS